MGANTRRGLLNTICSAIVVEAGMLGADALRIGSLLSDEVCLAPARRPQ